MIDELSFIYQLFEDTCIISVVFSCSVIQGQKSFPNTVDQVFLGRVHTRVSYCVRGIGGLHLHKSLETWLLTLWIPTTELDSIISAMRLTWHSHVSLVLCWPKDWWWWETQYKNISPELVFSITAPMGVSWIFLGRSKSIPIRQWRWMDGRLGRWTSNCCRKPWLKPSIPSLKGEIENVVRINGVWSAGPKFSRKKPQSERADDHNTLHRIDTTLQEVMQSCPMPRHFSHKHSLGGKYCRGR